MGGVLMTDQINLSNAIGALELAEDYLTANMVLVDVLANKLMSFEQLCNDTTKIFEQAREDANELRKTLETELDISDDNPD